jgi:hypothetical protein
VLLSLDKLEETLLKMPVTRWPLGKVVAVSENGVRAPGDDMKIASNLSALKRMLESHKVRGRSMAQCVAKMSASNKSFGPERRERSLKMNDAAKVGW